MRDSFQSQFKKSFEPIVLEGKLKEEEYETENVTVQIVELSTDEMAKTNNWIGANKIIYEEDKPKENENSDDDDDADEEEVPGFTVTSIKKKVKKPKTITEDESEDEGGSSQLNIKNNKNEDFKSKRAIGQYLAKKAQSSLKQSKAFQTKNKLDRIRNKKKTRMEKDKRAKLQSKKEKFQKGSKQTKEHKPSKFSRGKKGARK